MFSEYEALLRGILENPEDDAPRLVLSDWLEEQGEEERAKWIRESVWFETTEWHHKNKCPENSPCVVCVMLGLKVGGMPYAAQNGFISSVSLTCEAFVGGPCPTCENGSVDSGGSTPWGEPINEPCGHCAGTGRIEGVARELFSRHPITEVLLVDRKPYTTPSGTIVWLRFATLVDSYIPKELHKQMEFFWSWFNTEADAKDALSRACVDWGRNLVGLPRLDG